jgi:hypothetical protein
MDFQNAPKLLAVGLASFILGAACMFLLTKHTNAPTTTWFSLSTDGGGVGFSTDVLKSDIPMPSTGKPEGKAKFVDRGSGRELGYVIKLPIKPLPVSTLPEKYRRTTKLDNGLEIGPPEQVHYTGHFEFVLKDADGFVLTTISGPEENLSAGQDNIVQGTTKDTIPWFAVDHTRNIVVSFSVEQCYPCDAK